MSAGARYQNWSKRQRSQPKGCWSIPGLVAGKSGGGRCRRVRSHSGRSIRSRLRLEFVEDQIDQGLAIETQPTPQLRANQAVNAYGIVVAASVAGFGSSTSPIMRGVSTAAQDMGRVTAAFVNAALESVQNQGVDPALRLSSTTCGRRARRILQRLTHRWHTAWPTP